MVAVHTSMLSNGKVVAWDAFSAAPQSEHVWNPETGLFEPTPSGINLFCSGHVLLPDGRLFVAGGHELAYAGLKNTMLYSSNLGSWTAGPDMARGRWYPTTTTLPGRPRADRLGRRDPAGSQRPVLRAPVAHDPGDLRPEDATRSTAMPSAGAADAAVPVHVRRAGRARRRRRPGHDDADAGHRDRSVGDAGQPVADHRRQRGHVPARQGAQDRHLDGHRLRPAP